MSTMYFHSVRFLAESILQLGMTRQELEKDFGVATFLVEVAEQLEQRWDQAGRHGIVESLDSETIEWIRFAINRIRVECQTGTAYFSNDFIIDVSSHAPYFAIQVLRVFDKFEIDLPSNNL